MVTRRSKSAGRASDPPAVEGDLVADEEVLPTVELDVASSRGGLGDAVALKHRALQQPRVVLLVLNDLDAAVHEVQQNVHQADTAQEDARRYEE